MCSKVKYKKRGDALYAKKRINNLLLDVYKCTICKSWHLGRSRDKSRNSDRIGQVIEAHAKKLEKKRLQLNNPTV